MSDSLSVRLNHDRLHDIQTRASFETTGSFPILLHNGDAPVHVHLHLDDALSEVVTIPANNHFVDADTTQQVNVEVEEGPRPVEGRLKIVTGHGAETDYVAVTVAERAATDGVAIETASTDSEKATSEDAGSLEFDLPRESVRENAPVAVLGLLALAVAAGAATLSSSVAVLVGALAVIASVVAAAYFLAG